MKTRTRLSIVSACAIVAAAGCAALETGDVASKWSATMRELQLVPVFPPREDLRVGDIYFFRSDTPEEVAAIESRNVPSGRVGFLPIPVLVGRLNMGQQLQEQYGGGPMFGPTQPDNMDSSGSFSVQPSRDDAFTSGETNRPRLVGFPEFMSATYTEGDLSALVPLEALKVTAAAGFTSADKVTVRVPVAESYCLPLSAVVAKMLDENGNLTNVMGDEGAFVPSHVTLLTDAKSDKVKVGDTVGYLRVINEVYLARVVDVSLTSSASVGASAQVEPVIPVGRPTPAPSPTPEVVPDPAPVEGSVIEVPGGAEDDVPPPAAPPEPADLAARLNARLDQQTAGLSPGVSTRFVNASASSIGMRTTYERPVAIGYRGVLLRLVKADAEGSLSVAEMLAINSMKSTTGDTPVMPSP